MAKRDNATTRTNDDIATTDASGAATADTLEQRVVAFAVQLGRIAGTVHAKAEGWMDSETLSKQIAGICDGATDLLEQLAGVATKTSKKKPHTGAARGGAKGAAASSTRPGRNIGSRCQAIRMRSLHGVGRKKCGRPRPWSRRTGAVGAASCRRPPEAVF